MNINLTETDLQKIVEQAAGSINEVLMKGEKLKKVKKDQEPVGMAKDEEPSEHGSKPSGEEPPKKESVEMKKGAAEPSEYGKPHGAKSSKKMEVPHHKGAHPGLAKEENTMAGLASDNKAKGSLPAKKANHVLVSENELSPAEHGSIDGQGSPKKEAVDMAKDEVPMAKEDDGVEDPEGSANPAQMGGDDVDPAAPEQGHDDYGEDLHSMYAEMNDDALKAHYEAIKAEIFKRMDAGAGAESPEPPAADSMPPMDEAAPAPTDKTMKTVKGEAAMAKNESDFKELAAKVEALTKNFDSVAKVLTHLVPKPEGKAVTTTTNLAKSEATVAVMDLGELDFRSKLTELAATPSLNKSERDLINDYFFGIGDRDSLKGLFEKK